MKILHIAAYKFITLTKLEMLREELFKQCQLFALTGTILLSKEGMNLNLSGLVENINQFKFFLQQDTRFADLSFRENYSHTISFKRLKIKIKKEIITMHRPAIHPELARAPSLAPETLKEWLDEKRDVMLLDTRNAFEINFGTFQGAVHLNLQHFSEFPSAIQSLQHHQPVVTFCTGGIRCEKAALFMLDQGFSEVYQLEGGILNYFSKMGDAHYQGECFVFDERVTVAPAMFRL
ncbi:MAG: hypothetical protein A3F42_06220 [Gammaproteobacteria bacterium RIFCSPHIGHO2_12_FULL_37_34]|nr:MAG: hypothetical protein A3F42_06220 [Gammaproteobacteria bacterium RIFCSPHIGHO2_12_FULL_37_34]